MAAFVANGVRWGVAWVEPGDPRLVDREGKRTVGTTDPRTRMVHISTALTPPTLDAVLLHEVTHALTMSYGLLPALGRMVADGDQVGAEEWAAQLVERHAIEAVAISSRILGRQVCVRGHCSD